MKMQKSFSLAILAALLLSACSDGVPKVEDPYNPVDADGKPITGAEFNQRYCVAPKTAANETCERVRRATSIKSLKGKMPEGW